MIPIWRWTNCVPSSTFPRSRSFIMSRGFTDESWGETDENRLWQEVVLTDGHRLIMWRADDEIVHDR